MRYQETEHLLEGTHITCVKTVQLAAVILSLILSVAMYTSHMIDTLTSIFSLRIMQAVPTTGISLATKLIPSEHLAASISS